jgi:hypothetical protein
MDDPMSIRHFFLALLASLATAAHAASSVQMLTPLNTSVLGGESREYSARFFDPFGRPSAGESVTFSNDACGFFHNGALAVTVPTDASGVATATFTARPQGITCWIRATAGVQATFNVFTYTMGQVGIQATLSPANPRAGDAFTLTAGAYAGAYPIYDAELTARIVERGGRATVSPEGADSGRTGRVSFEVTPDARALGAYDIEIGFRGLTRRIAMAAPVSPLQDMWWGGPQENGWGLSVVQHGERLFVVIYAYDAHGKPVWYVMPGGAWNAGGSAITGALYLPRGTPYSAYDATQLVAGAPVGSATLTFSAHDQATLAYTIGGVSGSKAIRRQLFGPPTSTSVPQGLGDMWWGGAGQNGWGIALLQQHASLFGVWFTYDAAGDATWFVMPAGTWRDAATYEGRIYRTTGSPWLGLQYDVNALQSRDAGTFRLRFEDAAARFDYTIDGVPGSMELMRQEF